MNTTRWFVALLLLSLCAFAAGDESRTARIRGEIVRVAGEREVPVAGCDVTLVDGDASRRTATTDAAGRFEFEGVVPARTCEVRAAALGCEPVRVNGIVLLPRETRRIGALALGRFELLRVETVDERGDTLSGAAVEAFREPQGPLAEYVERSRVPDLPRPTLSAVTDESGCAELRLPPEAEWTVVASAKGRARVALQRVSTSDDGSRVVRFVVPPGERLAGRVLDADGGPVPHAVVAARRAIPMVGSCGTCDPPAFASPLWLRADANSAGRFAFEALPPGTIEVLAGTADGGVAIVEHVSVPDVRDVDVTLAPTATLAGRAIDDETGEPVPGVTVAVRAGFGARIAVTEGDGRFVLSGLRCGAELAGAVNAPPGWALARGGFALPDEFVLSAGETAGIDVRLHRSAIVSGRVLRQGTPVPGAEVTVATLAATADGWTRSFASSHADAAGAFRVDDVLPGRVVVCAIAPEDEGSDAWGPFQKQVVESSAGRARFAFDVAPGAEVTRDVDVRPSPPPKEPSRSFEEMERDIFPGRQGVLVRGRITTADGRPLVEARVLVARDAEFVADMFSENLGRPVAASGRFSERESIDGDTVAVRAGDLWHDATTVVAKVPAGADHVDVDVVLPARPVVTGRVTAGGEPVAGACVSLGDGVAARTAADGTFSARAKSGEVRLHVTAPGFVGASVRELKVPCADPVEVELSPAKTITGVVVDEQGAPVAGAVVAARCGDRDGGRVATAPDGTFRLVGLPPGEWTLRVASSVGGARELATQDAGSFDAGATDVRLVAAAGRRIAGRFVLADGSGIARSRVKCRPGVAGADESTTETDDAGRFEFTGLPAGTFSLSAVPRGDDSLAVAHADVESGAEPVVLRAEPAHAISGVVVDDAGAPVAGVELEAQRLDGDEDKWRRGKAKTDTQGRFSIVVPDGERFRLALQRTWGFSDRTELLGADEVAAGPKDVRIVAHARAGFAGIVVDPEGRPLAGVVLAFRVWNDDTTVTTGADGKFSVPPAGSERASFIARLAGRAPVQRFGVQPGGETIRVVMAPELRIRGRLVGRDGAPAPGRKLRLVSPAYPGKDLWNTTTDAEGRFDVGELCPGEWYAEALVQGTDGRISLGKVAAGAADVELRLPE